MERYQRERAARLAEKLLHIRSALKLSQNEIIRQLGLEDLLIRSRISDYETGKCEPALAILLKYAQIANVLVGDLIDDSVDLPKRLPVKQTSPGSRSTKSKPGKTRKLGWSFHLEARASRS